MATFGLLLIGTGDECLHLFVVWSLSLVELGAQTVSTSREDR